METLSTTTVSISGTKTSLVIGARYRFELATGTVDGALVARKPNGDLEVRDLDAGDVRRIRPSKIVSIEGDGSVLDEEPAPSREQLIRDLEAGSAAPEDFDPRGSGPDRYPDVAGLPTTPTAFVDQVRDILGAKPRGRYEVPPIAFDAHDVVATVRETSSHDGYVCTTKVRLETGSVVECGRVVEKHGGIWKHYVETRSIAPLRRAGTTFRAEGESATDFVRRLEAHPFYSTFIGTDAGQALLREAAEESRPRKASREVSGRAAVALDVPAGSKRCPGVPKREIEPHVAPIVDFGKHSGTSDGLSSTCRTCHRLFAAIQREKRAAARQEATVPA